MTETKKPERKVSSEEKTSEASKIARAEIIAVIRISGMVKVKRDVEETLDRMRLRRKYACVLIHKNKDTMGMIKKVKYYIAYGEIDRDVLEKLIKKRAESIEGRKKEIKIDVKKVVDGLLEGKKLSDFKLKEFFRLHPPRKGINSKLQYPKGVLGDNKNISKLIERML